MFENTIAGECEVHVPEGMEDRFGVYFQGTGMIAYDALTGEEMELDMPDDFAWFIEDRLERDKLVPMIPHRWTKKEMTVQCGWCKKFEHYGLLGAPVSHGICPKCLEWVLAKTGGEL